MCSAGSSASLSDSIGQLLFYANHDTVWGSNNLPLPNGTGLMSITSANYLSDGYQGVLLIKQPGNNTNYYHFNNGRFSDSRLEYAIIDKSLNSGLGDVITKKNILVEDSLTTKVTAIKHCNNTDIWITALCKSDISGHCYFFTYLLTRYGLNPMPVISKVKINLYAPFAGQMKFNLNGKILAFACETGVELFDFDNTRGLFSHRQTINFNLNNGLGLEFSPNGKILYVNNYQVDLLTYNVTKLVDEIMPSKWQLANNGKIYGHIYKGSFTPSNQYDNNFTITSYLLWDKLNIGQISNPNVLGASCNLDTNYISDYNYRTDYPYGNSLPDFPNFYIYKPKSDFQYSGNCPNMPIQFYNNQSGVDSIRWIFIDNGQTSLGNLAQHQYTQAGNYEVECIAYYSGTSDTSKHCVNIAGQGNTLLVKEATICEGTDTLINGLQPYGFNYHWNTGQNSSSIKINKPGLYILSYNTQCGMVYDTINVKTIYCDMEFLIPNVFTPNNDNINDAFSITLKNVKQISYSIYNRWGNEIINESKEVDITNTQKYMIWDGLIKEEKATSGVYYFVIKIVPYKGDPLVQKNFITLFE